MIKGKGERPDGVYTCDGLRTHGHSARCGARYRALRVALERRPLTAAAAVRAPVAAAPNVPLSPVHAVSKSGGRASFACGGGMSGVVGTLTMRRLQAPARRKPGIEQHQRRAPRPPLRETTSNLQNRAAGKPLCGRFGACQSFDWDRHRLGTGRRNTITRVHPQELTTVQARAHHRPAHARARPPRRAASRARGCHAPPLD